MNAVVEVTTERTYQCFIGSGLGKEWEKYIWPGRKIAVISSANLASCYQPIIKACEGLGAEVFLLNIAQGEQAKGVDALSSSWSFLARHGFTRSDLIISCGGGATSDLAGFVAATFLRGIDFLSFPTTVLAMVDASVGGKTGIDLAEGKNLVGAFHQPVAVVMNLDFLRTLPIEDVICGTAEIIKTGFIGKREIVELIEDNPREAVDPSSDRFAELVYHSVSFKAGIVSADTYESTSRGTNIGREILNYGHTFGHAVEAAEHFSLHHGHAVAIGMVYAGRLSEKYLGLPAEIRQWQEDLLATLGLPTRYSGSEWTYLRTLMSRDKKARGNQLRFVGLSQLYHAQMIEAPSEEILEQIYREMRS